MTTDGQVTTADGTRIAVRRVGTAAGVPVVLVHGSNGGLESLQPVAEGLGDAFGCWLMARRGHAPSDAPEHVNTFGAEVPDVIAVLAAAQAYSGRRPHLVGASYGATLALHAALAEPDALATLSLFEPPLFAAGQQLAPIVGQFTALLEAGDHQGAALLFARRVARVPSAILAAFADADARTDVDARTTEEVDAGLDSGLRALRHDLEAMAADSEDILRWSAVRTPTLVLGGADSWAPLPETMNALAQALPQAQQVVLPGQNHFVTATAPGLVADAVRGFLDRHR
ncbi:alpha/beta fold hydrolase [Frankia sp. R82]|uniref:alpha/beta fold hydrolase n=1 Tax=Frankia sp. R82 TaxID=2950553 RepID=UPI002042C3B6|nr:alpha/beta hydrolase [Frankia sp. R82]MCM3887589.1 alpha/beta hydrolase [Frankia sp. R82]